MVVVSPGPALLDTKVVTLYHTRDPFIGNLPVFVFLGPSTTTNATHNSSRIQAHLFSVAGLQSFQRLTISPTSPLYAAVHHLPEDKKGDEICRGLAVSLLKYYAEIPEVVKSSIKDRMGAGRPYGTAPAMFDEMHAAILAANMVQAENAQEIADIIMTALAEKTLSWVDVDVILPCGSITKLDVSDPLATANEPLRQSDDGRPLIDYGRYNHLVDLFGLPSFLPTSKLRRAPSRPTAVSRNRTLAEDQKQGLIREIQELVKTEESYTSKLNDLFMSSAASFCRNMANAPHTIIDPQEQATARLFPDTSLKDILSLNSEFLRELRKLVVDSTDGSLNGKGRDPTGTLDVGRIMLEFFPRFKHPYQEYLRASTQFPSFHSEVLRSRTSRFAQAVIDTGEQRVKSWLIEPVQRLPRYSLFIDNMVNLLPATHPAMTKILRARDIITDICSLDGEEPANNRLTLQRLRLLTSKWPESFVPEGRLITTIDAIEQKPPFGAVQEEGCPPSILLLFPDYVVVVRKLVGSTLTARGLLAEVDQPMSPSSSIRSNASTNHTFRPLKPLEFTLFLSLHETLFTESQNGRRISMTCAQNPYPNPNHYVMQTNHPTHKIYHLLGAYDGKAARLNEEIARARIEDRFPEAMRENEKWQLRSLNPQEKNLGLVLAIFENDDRAAQGNKRKCRGRIQVTVHGDGEVEVNEKPFLVQEMQGQALEIRASIRLLPDNRYLLEMRGFGNQPSVDTVGSNDLMPVLARRLGLLQRAHNQPITTEKARAHLSFTQDIVDAIRPRFAEQEIQSEKVRSTSPVKTLSSILGSYINQPMGPVKHSFDVFRTKSTANALTVPKLAPPSTNPQVVEEPGKNRVAIVSASSEQAGDSLGQLEDTFTTYIVALGSRRGNVVGRTLRGRGAADELSINELYNTLLEDPSRHQAAALVSVDVLFAAFEKFLHKAWNETMGPILSTDTIREMQTALVASTTQGTERFRTLLSNMTSQNRRAFTALISVLSDLLSAAGNDGDRGALVVTFAEALVVDGNSNDYITLLDHLVEDFNVLFVDESDFHPLGTSGDPGLDPGNDMEGPLQRTRSFNTGSIGSTASSIRKKFGFGTLSRESSKLESESKIGQVWRALSKKGQGDTVLQTPSLQRSFHSHSKSADIDLKRPTLTRPDSQSRPASSESRDYETSSKKGTEDAVPQAESLSRSSNLRSKSADTDPRRAVLARPYSQYRPASSDVLDGEPRSRPGSPRKTLSTLDPIGEGRAQESKPSLKTKRRSSLSDLKDAKQLEVDNFGMQDPPYRDDQPELAVHSFQTHKVSIKPAANLYKASPSELSIKPANLKENVPLVAGRVPAADKKPGDVKATAAGPWKRELGQAGIPVIRHVLQERPSLADDGNAAQNQPPPRKLKMQSPQKLRERLEREKKAMQDASPGLQAELARIGEELSAINTSNHGPRNVMTPMSSRIQTLEARIAAFITEAGGRTDAIRADVDSSLAVSEKKARSLDELYREANAENELLYERFNAELSRVLKGVRGGVGVEELRAKMKEAQDEAARLRNENQRLRRENAGLRSQLRGA